MAYPAGPTCIRCAISAAFLLGDIADMDVIFRSNAGLSRDAALNYLRALRIKNPAMTVVDIGGARNPWSRPVVDTYVDLFPLDGADVILGDVNKPDVWDTIAKRRFNFVICSHILEDIRDPVFVLGKIASLFRHGYIATPNKHVEFSHIQSRDYVGYAHHRWIFTLTDDELRFVSKFSLASHFSPKRRTIAAIKASRPVKALRGLTHSKRRLSDLGPLPWWNHYLAGPDNELAFIWSGDLNYRVINDDYAGDDAVALAMLYHRDLATGL